MMDFNVPIGFSGTMLDEKQVKPTNCVSIVELLILRVCLAVVKFHAVFLNSLGPWDQENRRP